MLPPMPHGCFKKYYIICIEGAAAVLASVSPSSGTLPSAALPARFNMPHRDKRKTRPAGATNGIAADGPPSNLLADMNHEIRTSMNGAVGMLELLLETDLTESQHQFATTAQDSVANLLELIEDIVDLSMIESHQLALRHAPFDLLQETRAACALERAAAFDKGVELIVRYPQALMLNGDPVRVRRVIASLIESAIGLARGGEVVVAVQTDDSAPQRCRIQVSVTASDLRITEAELAAILDLPIRSSVAALRPHGRTGLELVLCRELVKLMGGRLGIGSTSQQRVQFTLMLELPHAGAVAALSEQRPPLQRADASLAGKRILLADDNIVNQEVALRMLEKLGCIVDTADNGRQAVDMHRSAAYELILMDCQMPELDGYQATEQVRALEHGTVTHTPVIALTACTAQDEQDKCIACGMDDFLSKPIRPQALKEALARWLGGHDEAVTAPAQAEAPDDELDAVCVMFGADFAGLARLYQADSPPRIALLHEAHAAADYARLIQVAHAFSGSSASIGATALSALCRELELRTREGALNDFAPRMEAIGAEYARVSDRLRSMIAPRH
jgi:CheY-like chemotaxis protein/HPt (histidine-containing phosphotransfer) domain-containing protein